MFGASSPGPAYDVRNMNNRADHSLGRSAVTFTAADRFRRPLTNPVGPGDYFLDKGRLDTLRSAPFSFRLSHRAYDKVRRPGANQELLGKESVGPGSPLWSDIGKEGSKANSFSLSPRFFNKNPSGRFPGPGAYYRPLPLNATTLSVFGKPPTRSRLNLKALRRCCSRVWGVC